MSPASRRLTGRAHDLGRRPPCRAKLKSGEGARSVPARYRSGSSPRSGRRACQYRTSRLAATQPQMPAVLGYTCAPVISSCSGTTRLTSAGSGGGSNGAPGDMARGYACAPTSHPAPPGIGLNGDMSSLLRRYPAVVATILAGLVTAIVYLSGAPGAARVVATLY